MALFSFPKEKKVRKRSEYLHIYEHAQRFSGRFIDLYMLKVESDQPCRMGLTVSKKVGNAPKRSKVKRRLREIFRLHQNDFKRQRLMVWNARPRIAEASYQQIEQDVLGCCEKAKVCV